MLTHIDEHYKRQARDVGGIQRCFEGNLQPIAVLETTVFTERW